MLQLAAVVFIFFLPLFRHLNDSCACCCRLRAVSLSLHTMSFVVFLDFLFSVCFFYFCIFACCVDGTVEMLKRRQKKGGEKKRKQKEREYLSREAGFRSAAQLAF
ncbi:putative DNA primase large subunit [Trypanosoma cruzi Dm28c]|uniref:Putative DNA primase large subunit n=1 Tax=Trypanosoma cruzi Dm28c TaxID=1416333 RepID=V5BD97_TRYCR|nr:putative DNA primase large subunit [Trypanosoma cruzi Dm28c]